MVREFVDRLFDGAAHPLLVHLVKDRRLTKEGTRGAGAGDRGGLTCSSCRSATSRRGPSRWPRWPSPASCLPSLLRVRSPRARLFHLRVAPGRLPAAPRAAAVGAPREPQPAGPPAAETDGRLSRRCPSAGRRPAGAGTSSGRQGLASSRGSPRTAGPSRRSPSSVFAAGVAARLGVAGASASSRSPGSADPRRRWIHAPGPSRPRCGSSAPTPTSACRRASSGP